MHNGYIKGKAAGRLCPDYVASSIYDVELDKLRDSGISALILDIDNTLAMPGAQKPDRGAIHWIDSAREAGFDICILSNARRQRVASFASGFGIYAIAGAGKPARTGFVKALRLLNRTAEQVCVIGDQIFTDVYGARRLGILAIYTKPITKREVISILLKRIAEAAVLKYYRASAPDS